MDLSSIDHLPNSVLECPAADKDDITIVSVTVSS